MKLVIAYVHPGILNSIRELILTAGIGRICGITDALGYEAQEWFGGAHHEAAVETHLQRKVRLEISVEDGLAQQVIDAIRAEAESECVGEMFVLPIDPCVRISPSTQALGVTH
jgi:nitrogen regulatory protein PII